MDNSEDIQHGYNHDDIGVRLDGILKDVAANLPMMDFEDSSEVNWQTCILNYSLHLFYVNRQIV